MWQRMRKVIIENKYSLSIFGGMICILIGSIINNGDPIYRLDSHIWKCTQSMTEKITVGDKVEYKKECFIYERIDYEPEDTHSNLDTP